MPVRQRKLSKRDILDEDGEAWLRCEDSGFFEFQPEQFLSGLWDNHSERIVAEHVEHWPGTRPRRWWQRDAAEQFRIRLGGTGTPEYEVMNIKPAYSFGIPICWVSQWAVDYYTGVAIDIHGRLVNEKAIGSGFKGVAIDPDDPPRYESQATFLDRHGLFLAAERRRLTKADWEVELLE
jgi:hypothetical protein